MEIIRLTEKTLPWFLPILTGEAAQSLRKDPPALALGAVWEGTACGVLVFRYAEPLVDIAYLAVSDAYRRRGVATGMVNFLCRYAAPLDAPVTCTFSAAGREDALYRLFSDHPFFTVAEEEGFICALPLELLSAPSRLTPLRGRAKNVTPFFSLPAVERRQFRCAPPPREVPFLRDLGVLDTDFDAELCLCCRDREGVGAAIFCTAEPDGLELSLAWSAPGRQNDLLGLLAEACGRLAARGGAGVLRIAAVTPESAAIVDKIFPRRTVTERFYRAVWDMELPGEETEDDAV